MAESHLITDWDPFALGIHPAITADEPVATPLPTYLRRTHDDELDQALADVSTSHLVVLVGGSSTGKTRALYEAVARHPVLRTWPVVRPDTSEQPEPRPNTVLWLNETVVVLGTRSPTDDLAHRIEVPSRFDDPIPGTADPRIRLAANVTGRYQHVIQALAGGPMLVARHYHPRTRRDRYRGAVVSAAVDARRLGHRTPLPAALLRDAAPAYLTEEPGGWFDEGLDSAVHDPVHGITALRPAGTGYEIHDYLFGHASGARRRALTTTILWDALAEHTTDPVDRRALALTAQARLMYRYADTRLPPEPAVIDTARLDRYLAHVTDYAEMCRNIARGNRGEIAVLRHAAGRDPRAEEILLHGLEPDGTVSPH